MSYYSVKVCILGDSSVGKSSLALRFVENTFDCKLSSTIGAAFLWKLIKAEGGTLYKLQIWDTAGQERYKSLAPLYYHGASVILIVYDITQRKTLIEGAREWVNNVRKNCSSEIILLLVGNKTDLENYRDVEESEARTFAHNIGARFYETSAKTEDHITNIFKEICNTLEKRHNKNLTLICNNDVFNDRTVSVLNSEQNAEKKSEKSSKSVGCCV